MDTTKRQIEETLKDRQEVYGDFATGTEAFGDILDALDTIHQEKRQKPLDGRDRVAVTYIVMKLVRIAATPEHIDSWHDISGYAKLAEGMYNAT